MPASPPSRPSHAQGSPPVHESWMRNYEAVDYEIPLLHAQGNSDSGDEDEEVKKQEQDMTVGSRGMRSQTDQPPRTPPKTLSLSPKSPGNASADPRLPGPARTPSHTRNPSSQSTTSSSVSPPPPSNIPQQRPPFQSQQLPVSVSLPPLSFDINNGGAGVLAEGQMGTGPSGSATTGYVTNFSHQSSLSTTTANTATPPGGPAFPSTSSRSPRSPSFRSSPLAASVSSSAPGVKIPSPSPYPYPTQAPPTTIGLPPSGSSSSSVFATSSSLNTANASSAAMNASSSMSNPQSKVSSSSSSTPPSSFSQSGQASSSGQNIPSMSSPPYSQYPLPNATSSPLFSKPGTRPNPATNNTNNNNSSHMNPAAYMHQQRIASEDSRPFVGAQGMEGGSGRISPHSQLGGGGSGFMPTGGPGVSVGLRDPSSVAAGTSSFSHNTYNNVNYNNNNGHPHNALLPSSSSRGSMILYRLSATEDGMMLPPPGVPGLGLAGRRTSVNSNSGDSIVSMSGDSKYPLVGFAGGSGGGGSGTRTPGTPGRPGTPGTPSSILGNRGGELSLSEIGKVQGGLVAYVYDPGQDLDADELDEEEEEWVKMVGGHVPRGDLKGFGSFGNAHVRMNVNAKMQKGAAKKGAQPAIRTSNHTPPPTGGIPWRGLINVSTLIVLIIGLLCLFLLYPVWRAYNNNGVDQLILGNTRINSTGQAVNEVVLDTREWRLPVFDRDFP